MNIAQTMLQYVIYVVVWHTFACGQSIVLVNVTFAVFVMPNKVSHSCSFGAPLHVVIVLLFVCCCCCFCFCCPFPLLVLVKKYGHIWTQSCCPNQMLF